MNIKTIVKVMNFHALLRVDHARKEAEQYRMLEQEVAKRLDLIQNNRNFILDRWILMPKEGAPRLRFYIGSDLGFCGAVNASVNNLLDKEVEENTVIVIGRKLHSWVTPALRMSRDEFDARYAELEAILDAAVRRRSYSGIDLCYHHYYNISRTEPVVKTIFPLQLEQSEHETYTEDFAVEGGDIDTIMEDLVITYLNYELKSASVNAYASENMLRQSGTDNSLRKIDELETEQLRIRRKLDNEKAVRKVIDSYVKTNYRSDAN